MVAPYDLDCVESAVKPEPNNRPTDQPTRWRRWHSRCRRPQRQQTWATWSRWLFLADFELIPTVEMETIHPVQGYFGGKFPAICNHCGVMAAWSCTTIKKFWKICAFFGKTTSYGRIFQILFRKFSGQHRWTCCVQILWNLADGKSVKSCVAYMTKKQQQNSPAVCTAQMAPTICLGQPPTMYSECFRFNLNRFTFGGVTAKRVNTAKTRQEVNPIFGWSLASSRITMKHNSKFTNSSDR